MKQEMRENLMIWPKDTGKEGNQTDQDYPEQYKMENHGLQYVSKQYLSECMMRHSKA